MGSDIMKKECSIAIVFLFLCLLFTDFIIVDNQIEDDGLSLEENMSIVPPRRSPTVITDAKYRANVVPNNGFEEKDVYGGPDKFSIYTNAYRNINYSYTDLVSDGSKSCLIGAMGTNYSDANPFIYDYYTQDLYLSEILYPSFDYYLKAMPDLDNGAYARIYFQFYNETHYNYLYYYLSHNQVLSNGTNAKYIDLNSTLSTWHQFNRNLTADFENAFGMSCGSYRQTFMRVTVYSPSSPIGKSQMVVDDVSNINSTSYEYITDGSFESGCSFNQYISTYGTVESIEGGTEGSYATNLTISNKLERPISSYANLRYDFRQNDYRSYFATKPEETILSFDWLYDDLDGGGTNQRAYLFLSFSNETFSLDCISYLGRGENYEPSYSNTSGTLVLPNDDFGSRNEWKNYQIDLYSILQNYPNVSLYDIIFYVYTGSEIVTRTTLLIDNLQLITYPTADPGFEQIWYSNDAFVSWDSTYSLDYINKTNEAFSGQWAANISSHGNIGQRYMYRSDLHYEVEEGVYADFYWKLDKLVGTSTYAYIQLVFEGDYYLNYILAQNFLFMNDTDTVGYELDEINQTGTWHHLYRNLKSDLDGYFGQQLWNLTRINIYVSSTGSDVVTLLLDDFHLRDGVAPIVDLVEITNTPTYYEEAQIRVQSHDALSPISFVTIFYRNESSWSYVNATLSGDYYTSTIPTYAFGVEVEFYVEIVDLAGNKLIDNNGGGYYNYIIVDDILPTLALKAPYNNSVVTGEILIELDTLDEGSTVDYLEVYLNMTLIQNITSDPWEFNWDTRDVENGTYELTAYSFDHAGNMKELSDSYYLIIANDQLSPQISSVQLNPYSPNYDEEVEVIVGIIDQSEIKNVTINYKIGDEPWDFASMAEQSGLYYFEFDSQPWETEVQYYIIAYDIYDLNNSVGSISSPLSYIVGDDIRPTIELDGPYSKEVLSGTQIEFTISASDEGSGLDILEISILAPGGNITEFTEAVNKGFVEYLYSFNTTSLSNGEYTLTFRVRDQAGNSRSISRTYLISNPEGFFDEASLFLRDLMVDWGILLGAGGVLGLWGIEELIRFSIKRRKGGKS